MRIFLLQIVTGFIFLNYDLAYSKERESLAVAFKYYEGVSEPKESEAEATTNAINNAYQNALSEIYGVKVSIHQVIESDMSLEKISKKTEYQTGDIKLIGFEQMSRITSMQNDKFVVKVKYRYPVSEIRKLALAENSTDVNKNFVFNKMGNAKYPELTIRAFFKGHEIADADVYLNDKKIAFTPLQVRTKLKIGENRIVVIHPDYENFEHLFYLNEVKDYEFKFDLKPAMTLVDFQSNISDTEVYIDNNFIGKTPLAMNLSVHKKFLISFKKDGYENFQITDFKVNKDSLKIIKATMVDKVTDQYYGPGCEDENESDEDNSD